MIKMIIEVTPEIAIKVAELLASAKLTAQPTQPVAYSHPTYTAPTLTPAPPVPVQVQAQETPAQAQEPPVQAQETSEYTAAQVLQACAPLIAAGKQQEIVKLIESFGYQSINQIPPERLREFAEGLIGLGAQI